MKLLSLLLILISLINFINCDDVYTNNLDFGAVKKGALITQKYVNIGLPSTNFNLEGIQVLVLNKTSGQPFNHGYISTCAVDFTINGMKVVSFTASNINNQLTFPSPYIVPISQNVNLTISMYTLNTEETNLTISYYMKYSENSGSSTIVKLTRTASSVVPNFSSFNVPAGNGSGYTIQNTIASWPSNAEAMDFQATVSPGIISISFIELLNGEQTLICKSVPTYVGKELYKMSGCNNVVSLYKGSSYITQAVYNNTVALKNVFGTLGFYVGYPQPPRPTTTSASTTGGSSTHSTTTTGGTGSTSSKPTTGGGAGTGGSSSSKPTTGGGAGTGGSSSSTTSQTSGSKGDSSNSQSESGSNSQFTTTSAGASSEVDPSSDETSTSTYTSGTSGSSGFIWSGDKFRKVEIY